ncbi:MAG: glucose-1-phosphate thymidylyltransferase [Oligoflexales bacterium]|nr:glucose-1-phosphate thymidylyltransferase [Oligoflexales bacterium]
MACLLPLENFVNSENIRNFDQYPEDSFDLLGKNLEKWLKQRLESVGVTDKPIIKGQCHPNAVVEGPVYVEEGAIIEPFAYVKGPAFIGAQTEVRQGAYIRGNVYAGFKCVIGHTTEVKGSVFFDEAKAGHFAYVGDSILGFCANLGAGTKLANLKIKGKSVSFKDPITGKPIDTGLRKLGAIIGDRVQTGCNSVLSPGSLLLPGTAVLPTVHFHGTLTKGWAK